MLSMSLTFNVVIWAYVARSVESILSMRSLSVTISIPHFAMLHLRDVHSLSIQSKLIVNDL